MEELSDDELMFQLDRKDTKVWLVKVPQFVAEQWTEQHKTLGTVKIHNTQINRGGKMEPQLTVHLPHDEWAQGLPKNYNLHFTQMAPVNEFIFTENDKGQAVEIAGKVEHECTLAPIMDDDYHHVMQERSKLASISTRVSQVLDTKQAKRTRIQNTQETFQVFLLTRHARLIWTAETDCRNLNS
jgi:transcription initiation factor TFIIF subunit beta